MAAASHSHTPSHHVQPQPQPNPKPPHLQSHPQRLQAQGSAVASKVSHVTRARPALMTQKALAVLQLTVSVSASSKSSVAALLVLHARTKVTSASMTQG